MKITYLKLENFIGIFNGTGKYEIEIDFNSVDSDNNILLFQGKNGCGKTATLSCLQPFSGTLDDRTEIIIPNKDGYKEIHYSHNGHEYIIKHHYIQKKKTTIKSYISKDGEELNPNGTVRSFEEIVERELDVTPSFFVLARIGNNVKNFIGMRPAERKNYMSKFLPDITQYLEEYKKINDKSLYVNKKIKSVIAEIDKLDDEENLKDIEEKFTESLNVINKTIDRLKENINKNKGVLTTMNIDTIESEYETAVSKVDKTDSNIETLLEQYEDNISCLSYVDYDGKLEDIDEEMFNNSLSDVTNDITEKEKDLAVLKANNENKHKAVESAKGDLERLKTELESYSLEKDYDEFISMREELEESLNTSNKELSTYDDKYNLECNDEEISKLQQYIKYIQEDSIFNEYELDVVNIFHENYKEGYDKTVINQYNDALETKEEYLSHINDNEKKVSFLQSKLPLKDILEQRPEECSINTCSFISEALKYSDVEDKIETLEKEISEYKDKIDELDIDTKEALYNYSNSFIRLYNEVSNFSDLDKLNKLFPSTFDNKENFLKFITMDKNIFIDEFDIALHCSHILMDISNNTEILKDVNHNIEVLESKDKLIKKTKEEISAKNTIIEESAPIIEKYKTDILTYNKEIEEYNEQKEIISEIIKIKSLYDKSLLVRDKYQTIIKNLSTDKDKIDNIKEQNDSLMSELSKVMSRKDQLDNELDDVKYKLKRLNEFKKDLEYLQDKAENIEHVKRALSPTKGIPLLFVDVYLKKTKKIANELLDCAFNGRFYIDDFELSESDFFIKIVKDGGLPINDVTLTSQGEMALIGLAISLAIIQQSKKAYNIIAIDEMDKELDENNRRAFVDILEKQLDILNVEQCFLISHNKEFDSYNLDLLLFNEHGVDTTNADFMNGKHVVFSV